jgi:hypothetical protein
MKYQKYMEAKMLFEQERDRSSPDSILFESLSNFYASKGKFEWNVDFDLNIFKEQIKNGQVSGFQVKISDSSKIETISNLNIDSGFNSSAVIYEIQTNVDGTFKKVAKKLKTSANDFQLVFGAKGFKFVNVSPKNWFNLNALLKYKNGYYKKASSWYTIIEDFFFNCF